MSEEVNTTPPKKEVEVLTDSSLVMLARYIAQEKNNGVVLPMMLNIPTTNIVNVIYDVCEDGIGGDNEKQRVTVAERCLLDWKNMTSEVKPKERVKRMEKALKDMGKADIADVFMDRYSNNQEITQDAFA